VAGERRARRAHFFIMSSGIRATLKKALLPVLLTAAGVWLLVGCVYIPTFGRVSQGSDASRQVGNARSKKPLQVSRATRDDVLRVLGTPRFTSSSGLEAAYAWEVQNGYTVWPLCLFSGYPVNGKRTLVLRFGGDGVLRSSQVLKSDANVIQISAYGPGIRLLLPPDLEEDRIAQLRRSMPATRTTAAPPPQR
jgi:hypothetical protein